MGFTPFSRFGESRTSSHEECFQGISSRNLDRVRKLKSAMPRLTARVQKVQDELEQLLDDDNDMADLYLSRNMAGASSPNSNSGVPNWFPASPTIGSKLSTAAEFSQHWTPRHLHQPTFLKSRTPHHQPFLHSTAAPVSTSSTSSRIGRGETADLEGSSGWISSRTGVFTEGQR